MGQLAPAVAETVVVGKLTPGGQAQIVKGAKECICSRKIAGRFPSLFNSRSKVIVLRVMGACSRKGAGIDVMWCCSRR